MTSRSPLQLAFYADDFTGSTDALEQLSLAGLRTILFTEAPGAAQLAALGPLDAVGLAGATRSMAPEAMAKELHPAFTALRELRPRHVHYKVCSTFDSSPKVGSIGRAIDVGAEVFGGRFVPLVVGAPPLGRYCAFGNLFARMGIGSNGAIHRLDRHPSMSRHPVTPADEADLRLHLTRQTRQRIALLDFLALDLTPEAAAAALDEQLADRPDIVLFDALTSSHLLRIGQLLELHAPSDRPLFSVGSSAIEMALGAAWTRQGLFAPPARWPELAEARPLLVLSGSCSPVTAAQITHAEADGFASIALDVAGVVRGDPAAWSQAAEAVTTELRAGRSTILHTSRGRSDPAVAALDAGARGVIGAALGAVARVALAATPVRRLLIAGGDSSSHAAAALGIKALSMIAPLTPGAPMCRAHAPGSPADGIEVNFKGGQVGAPDYFSAARNGSL